MSGERERRLTELAIQAMRDRGGHSIKHSDWRAAEHTLAALEALEKKK